MAGGFFTIEPPGKPSGAFKNYILNSKRKTLKKKKQNKPTSFELIKEGAATAFRL